MLIDSKKINAVILYIHNRTSPIEFSVLIHSINKDDTSLKLSGGELTQILHELKRLEIVFEVNVGYIIPEPVKRQISSLSKEFINKPHEHYLEEERKELDAERQHKWYLRTDAKQRFDDYPIVKRQKNIAVIIAVITTISTIVLGVLQIACN